MAMRCRASHTVMLVALVLSAACQAAGSPTAPDGRPPNTAASATAQADPTATEPSPAATLANVISVEVSGQPGAYTFSVSVESPDEGCDQYADWWEVVSEDGALIYRRILLHSHVDEQPFARSGGPVEIEPGTTVWVRAHMSRGGYGGRSLKGSVEAGFVPADAPSGFADDLAEQEPQPNRCAF